MATTKRPAFRKGDRVTLAWHKSVIPPYDGKPFVLRDTVLTVSHLTGTGSKRNPWHVVVTDGTHFWTLEPDDVVHVAEGSTSHSTRRDLDAWLDRNGYRSSPRHARKIHQPPTGREVFAAHERDHHITTSGRRALTAAQFALPPGPEEKRRGIKGRLPIDTLKRARNALSRAAQMKKHGHLSAGQLAAAQRKVHAAWPSIESAS
jgi:sulfite reductase alpha subunit-like flavoprotein